MTKKEELSKLEYKMFSQAMRGFHEPEGSIARILTIHLITEAVLEKIIGLILDRHASAVLSVSLSYRQKLELCSKLQFEDGERVLNSSVVGSLKKLNVLRNNLAHNLDHEVTKEELLSVFYVIEPNIPDDVLSSDLEVIVKSYHAHIFPLMFGRKVNT